jgi:hypothetical protein
MVYLATFIYFVPVPDNRDKYPFQTVKKSWNTDGTVGAEEQEQASHT